MLAQWMSLAKPTRVLGMGRLFLMGGSTGVGCLKVPGELASALECCSLCSQWISAPWLSPHPHVPRLHSASDQLPWSRQLHAHRQAQGSLVLFQEAVEWPLLLHNHSSVLLPDEKELLLIGGGGNCFSFGTHLNPQPVCLDLCDILTS